jgi:4a-hydroxytetrahydrobiopterin dehydratase
MEQNEQPLREEEVRERLQRELPDWDFDGGWIRREFETDGWPTTLMLVNQIGYLAEAAYHHPDLDVGWGRVGVRLQTHSAGGITARDLELARRIEEVVLWRPAQGSALEGTPNRWVRGQGRTA